MQPRGAVFVTCDVCTHAAVMRRAGACRLCGGSTSTAEAPPDLFSGWRCGCFQCAWTPC